MSEKDYKQVATEILKHLGGKDNIQAVSHCVTRLRLALGDDLKVDKEALTNVDLVKGCFSTAGQFQVILGMGIVEHVCREFLLLVGEDKAGNKDAVKDAGAQKLNLLQKGVKVLADVFIPILPAIVTAGLLMGVNNLLTAQGVLYATQSVVDVHPQFGQLALLINTFASTAFIFLPVLIGFSAAKRFGASPVLGIVLGALLVHPDLLNGWEYGKALLSNTVPHWHIFGLDVPKVGYQGSVLPILFAVYFMSKIEAFLRKVTPSYVSLLVVPMFTLVISGFLTFMIIGPITRELGNLIAQVMIWLFTTVPIIGALIYGGLFAPLVVTGMHYTFLGVNIQLISQTGSTFLWPIEALSNVAQASAALAIFFASKEVKLREVASASAVSAYFGVTEPAMFGVNLRFKFPFFCAMAGSACAAVFITLQKCVALGIGIGGLPAFISILPIKIGMYLIGMLIAVIIPFVLTFVLAKKYLKEGA